MIQQLIIELKTCHIQSLSSLFVRELVKVSMPRFLPASSVRSDPVSWRSPGEIPPTCHSFRLAKRAATAWVFPGLHVAA